MREKGGAHRNSDDSPGRVGHDLDFLRDEIDVFPREIGKIPERLSGVEPEENQGFHFAVGGGEDFSKIFDLERAALSSAVLGANLQAVAILRGVLGEKAVTPRILHENTEEVDLKIESLPDARNRRALVRTPGIIDHRTVDYNHYRQYTERKWV